MNFVIEQYAAGCLVENIEVLETVEDETQTPAQVASEFAKALTDAVKGIAAGAPESQSAPVQDADKHTDGEGA